MILQQLAVDAERLLGRYIGKPSPRLYDLEAVKWIVELRFDGSFVACIPTAGRIDSHGRDYGKPRFVPVLPSKLTSGIRPALLADTASYTFGYGPDDRRVMQKHNKYLQLLDQCAQVTQYPGLLSVIKFLKTPLEKDKVIEAFKDKLLVDDLITFRVEGELVIDHESIQLFWHNYCSPSGMERDCVVCGKKRKIPDSLPIPIKREIPNLRADTPLASINADSFESLNLKGGRTLSICQECGEKFGKAMNCLLADVNQHLSIGPVIYIFWVTQETEFNPFLFLDKPDPKLVRELLMTYLTAKRITIEDDTKFNMLSMTSSGGSRVAFRDWLHTSLGSVKNTIATWFSQLSIVDEYGRDAKPLGIWSLTRGLYPDHLQYRQVQEQMKKNPLFPQVLAHCALHGAPLPKSLLAQAVNRCRAEQDVTYPRAALIKAVLCSNIGKKEDMMTGLNLEERRPGYVCGRLLAVLDEIQYSALGKINATLVDRFYGSASTAPASVFGTLISHAQPHLAKIRKNPKKKGHSEALKERLEEVLLKLESFPKTLAIQDQALFALGYYHQRAASRDATNRAISDRKAEHDAQDTMTEEDTTDVE